MKGWWKASKQGSSSYVCINIQKSKKMKIKPFIAIQIFILTNANNKRDCSLYINTIYK